VHGVVPAVPQPFGNERRQRVMMAEYDLDGWKAPDLTDPGEVSHHVMRGAGR
jgi:hypothetical protein